MTGPSLVPLLLNTTALRPCWRASCTMCLTYLPHTAGMLGARLLRTPCCSRRGLALVARVVRAACQAWEKYDDRRGRWQVLLAGAAPQQGSAQSTGGCQARGVHTPLPTTQSPGTLCRRRAYAAGLCRMSAQGCSAAVTPGLFQRACTPVKNTALSVLNKGYCLRAVGVRVGAGKHPLLLIKGISR